MTTRAVLLSCGLLLSIGVAALPRLASSEGRPSEPAASVDLSGRWAYNASLSDDAREKMRPGRDPGGRPGGGGPMMNLTDEERAQLQSMTDEERAEFMEEKFGEGGLPAGGPMRGGTLEGEVLEVADDTITLALESGGSQTVYTDAETLVAYADGAGDLAAGAQVLVIAEPAADGVTNASVLVVK